MVSYIQNSHSLRLLSLLVRRDLKVKYRGSFLGYLWSMLNPLLFMLIISFVFSHLMRGVEHYDLFVLAGILFWNMTAMAIMGGTSSFVNNAGLLLKVKTPIWIFAIVPLGTAVVNLFLATIPYIIILFFKGLPVPPTIVFMPLVLICFSIFLAGISLLLATANVFFRDVAHVVDPLMQLMFYATPIIYDRTSEMVPEKIQILLGFNPMTRFVEVFRATMFKPEAVSPELIATLVLISIASLAFGIFVFKRKQHRITFKL